MEFGISEFQGVEECLPLSFWLYVLVWSCQQFHLSCFCVQECVHELCARVVTWKNACKNSPVADIATFDEITFRPSTYSLDISMGFFSLCKSFAFTKPFGKALLLIFLETVEAYREIIYVKRWFGLIFEVSIYSVQPFVRESLMVDCVYLCCSGSDKAEE